MFFTRGDQFIVEPLWNESKTTMTSDNDDDDDAAAAGTEAVYHVIYRRSAVKSASSHRVEHCGLNGPYFINSFLHLFWKIKLAY